METLSERYDIVLSRCEGLLNIIEKERALAFSLNDRYKKSDDCIKVIGKTLDSICEKMGVQAKVGVTQPLMPMTLKEVPSFSAMHHSLVLDKAHLVFSSCQTVCPYTHIVFLGFVYWIEAVLGKGQCEFAQRKVFLD